MYIGDIRPHEEGRGAIVQLSTKGDAKDMLPQKYSALSQVHEYGGSSFALRGTDGHLIFTDLTSKAVLDLDPESGSVETVLEGDTKIYYADFSPHPLDSRWVLAIKENHHPPTIAAIENTLVVIDTSSKQSMTLAKGEDFYTYPRFNSDGKQICWIQFSFPNMPWHYTELWIADFNEGQISNAKVVAGHDIKASVTQPLWSSDGSLFFVDDRSGWWQLYRYTNGEASHIPLKGLEEAEFGGPDWWLGSSAYGILSTDSLVAFANKDGKRNLITVDLNTGSWKDLGCPIVEALFDSLKVVNSTTVAIIGATSNISQSLFLVDINSASSPKVLKSSIDKGLPEGYASMGRNIKFPRTHGPGGGPAYATYFPPTNPKYEGPENSLPPLIVAVHGGPTYQQFPGLYMRDTFLTTRGYALVQVNYVGSTGYGKKYASLLDEQWGVSDIADTVSCVEYLAKEGLIDKSRVGLTGHSAGGYATMQGLAVYPDVWACGVAESGISSLDAMLSDTHKFESNYLQALCWPADASAEQIKEISKDRSPITRASKIKAPILLMGGDADPICPPNQNVMLADKIKESGTTVKLKLYEGEGHIFSKAETLKSMEVEREIWFRKYLVDESK